MFLMFVKSDFIRSWPIFLEKAGHRTASSMINLKGYIKWWCLPHWFGSKFLKQHFKSFLCADYIKTIILTTLQDFTVSYRAKSEKCQLFLLLLKLRWDSLHTIRPMQSILTTHLWLIENNIKAPLNSKDGVKSWIGVIVKHSHQQTDSIC